MIGGQESARSTLHLAELFRLADKAGLLANPELATRRMKAVLATRGFVADSGRRTEVSDANRRALDEAKALGCSCIVLVAGGLPQYSGPGSAPSKDIAAAWAQVHDGLAEMLEYARTAGVPLAIEPLHP